MRLLLRRRISPKTWKLPSAIPPHHSVQCGDGRIRSLTLSTGSRLDTPLSAVWCQYHTPDPHTTTCAGANGRLSQPSTYSSAGDSP